VPNPAPLNAALQQHNYDLVAPSAECFHISFLLNNISIREHVGTKVRRLLRFVDLFEL